MGGKGIQPHLLQVIDDHIKSHFVQMQNNWTKGLEIKSPAVPGRYYLNPFHKLVTLHINEVMKEAVREGLDTYTGSS